MLFLSKLNSFSNSYQLFKIIPVIHENLVVCCEMGSRLGGPFNSVAVVTSGPSEWLNPE